jgi:hypothetical protein
MPVRAAESDENGADARCLVLSMQLMVNAGDDAAKTAAMLANLYYLGRLDGRAPGFTNEARLREEIARMTPETASYEAMRCGVLMSERTLAISDIGNRLVGPPAGP